MIDLVKAFFFFFNFKVALEVFHLQVFILGDFGFGNFLKFKFIFNLTLMC